MLQKIVLVTLWLVYVKSTIYVQAALLGYAKTQPAGNGYQRVIIYFWNGLSSEVLTDK